tara:strand:+ start:128 stop:472 length:345 start_codon:yes stop_codon:yes gene_type:complete
MGEGNIGMKSWAERFRQLCPGKTYSLEIINLRTPRVFRCRQANFWKHYGDIPASVFAGFLNLAHQGKPYANVTPGPQGAGPDSTLHRKFLIRQERRDVEQAVRFAKEVLHIGMG